MNEAEALECGTGEPAASRRWPWRATLFGLAGATGLLGFYLGIISWAQGWEHATAQLRQDAWFIVPVAIGFGTQIALFTYLRRLHAARRAGVAATAGSTTVSTATMLACCAHHVADVLPVIGLSGAAIFLNEVKTPMAGVSLALNAAGIAILAHQIQRLRPRRAVAAVRPTVPAVLTSALTGTTPTGSDETWRREVNNS